jgi:hypothetical protein
LAKAASSVKAAPVNVTSPALADIERPVVPVRFAASQEQMLELKRRPGNFMGWD